MTIRAVLIINNHGKPRLTKFYAQLPPARQQALIHRIYKLVSKRPDTVCNFLDTPELTPLLPPDNIIAPANAASGASASSKKKREADSQTGSQRTAEDELRVIYRHYATLYFVFVVDQSESELGILDLIQVFVESLDRCFENVCELDLIFHFDEVSISSDLCMRRMGRDQSARPGSKVSNSQMEQGRCQTRGVPARADADVRRCEPFWRIPSPRLYRFMLS